MCCFLGGVSATTYKNIFRCLQFNRSFSHKSWIMLALCPVNGSSTPRCVYTSHVSSAEFCDSNMVLRGVSLWGLLTVNIILMGVLCWCKNKFFLHKFSFSFWFFVPFYFSNASAPTQAAVVSAYIIVNLLLKSVSAEISCFYFEKFISWVL